MSSLSAPRGDDRLDAVTAEAFFAAPADDAAVSGVSVSEGSGAAVSEVSRASLPPVSTPTQPELPVAASPAVSSLPLPAQSVLPAQSALPAQSVLPAQSTLPPPSTLPSQPLAPLPTQPITPLPTQPLTPLPTSPTTPRTKPEIRPLPQSPSPTSPMPFMPTDATPNSPREVRVSYGSHCLLAHVPHTNLDALSLSSFGGPLTQGKQKEKVVQWLETQKRESTRLCRVTCSDRRRVEAALEHPPDPSGEQRHGGTQSQSPHA